MFLERYSYGQGQAENIGHVWFGEICRRLLPYLKRPAIDESVRLQPADRNSSRTQERSGDYPQEQQLKLPQILERLFNPGE